MKSPFPGMDPYLEQHWGDVHQAFITYLRDALQLRLPAGLRARMQERVYIELPEEGRHESYPDVRVFEYPGRRSEKGEVVPQRMAESPWPNRSSLIWASRRGRRATSKSSTSSQDIVW